MTEPTTHNPCCTAHGVNMTCERYRRTHLVEVRPCCNADRAALDDGDTVAWYITFGLGGPHGTTYTVIRVPAQLAPAQQEERARQAAFAEYGNQWAFNYPPEEFYDAIERWDLTLREVIFADDRRPAAPPS